LQTDAQLPSILILQTHNAAGQPAPARFEQVVDQRSINTLGSDAMDFLRPLNPRQTAVPGVFTYVDPLRGSGELRLQRFSPVDAQRVQELVRMSEISAAVGQEPFKPADIAVGRALVVRTNNPWVLIGFGAVLLVFGVVLLALAGGAGANSVAYAIMGALLALVAVALIIVGLVRAPWWHRARDHARQNGGELPPDIKGL